MSVEVKQHNENDAPEPLGPPRCPYCKSDPLQFAAMTTMLDPARGAVIFYCGNPECRCALGISLIQVALKPQSRIVPADAAIINPRRSN